jgi:hypothetical protein
MYNAQTFDLGMVKVFLALVRVNVNLALPYFGKLEFVRR